MEGYARVPRTLLRSVLDCNYPGPGLCDHCAQAIANFLGTCPHVVHQTWSLCPHYEPVKEA